MLVNPKLPMIRLLLLLLFLSFGAFAQDQQLLLSPREHYNRGLEKLQDRQYAPAREAFSRYLEQVSEGTQSEDARFYLAYCGLFLENLGSGARLEEFTQQYPDHPLSRGAYVALGNYYFELGDYQKTIEYLSAADLYILNDEEFAKANFRLGLSYFQEGENERSLVFLDRVKGGGSAFRNEAYFYAALAAFKLENFFRARQDFNAIAEDPEYRSKVPYYLSRALLEEENYTELASYTDRALDIPRVSNRTDVLLLSAEGHYRIENYDRAIERFETYAAALRGRPSQDISYKMGYAYLQMSKENEAMEQFKTITSNDIMGQMAAYYSGHIHARQGNAPFAVTAFKRAADMPFDAEVAQDAAFNYAKASIQMGQFREALSALEKFARDYPANPKVAEANDLMIEALLNSNDYARAIEYIESLPQRTERINRVYQKVAFYRGAEYFNDQRFPLAVQLFQRSIDHPYDKALQAEAWFWMAEAYSIGRRYEDAIKSYETAQRLTPPADLRLKISYGLGYALYNTNDYRKALSLFQSYTRSLESASDKQQYDDALLRLADCQFVLKDYDAALGSYNKAILQGSSQQDYAHYQKGLVYSYLSNESEAKNSFQTVLNSFRESRYYDNALLQLAQVDFESGSYQEAGRVYSRLIEQRSSSPLVPYALLNRAISNVNLRNYPEAERDYRAILDRYINHPSARSAILGLQDVMNQTGSGDFERYLARFRSANPDKQGLESIEFEAAKGLYFNQQYPAAIAAFVAFQKDYPQSGFLTEARYYLAESYYRNNQDREALQLHTILANTPGFEQINRSLDRAAELEFGLGNFRQAFQYYQRLQQVAQNRRDEYTALEGMMKASFEMQEYEQVQRLADRIMEQGSVTPNARAKALIFKGRAALSVQDTLAAQDYFLNTAQESKDELGAEAQYRLAMIQFLKKDYARSIELLFDLNNQFGNYDLWLGRSFLLLADNYIALEEFLQAKATLNSVSENSPLKEIRDQARAKLELLEREMEKNDEN